MAQIIKFNETPLSTIERNGETFIKGADIEKALGYVNAGSVSKIFRANQKEFDATMYLLDETDLSESDKSKNLKARALYFNRRGAWLIGMFARTKLAAAFRVWVLDILEEKTDHPQIEGATGDGFLIESELSAIQDAVNIRAEKDGMTHAEIYMRVRNKFRVSSYKNLPRDQFANAMFYVATMLTKEQKKLETGGATKEDWIEACQQLEKKVAALQLKGGDITEHPEFKKARELFHAEVKAERACVEYLQSLIRSMLTLVNSNMRDVEIRVVQDMGRLGLEGGGTNPLSYFTHEDRTALEGKQQQLALA